MVFLPHVIRAKDDAAYRIQLTLPRRRCYEAVLAARSNPALQPTAAANGRLRRLGAGR